jgi:ribose-phosphate pyrophosphokinase
VLINKERTSTHSVEITGIEGETEGKTALIIEDIIDTGNTLVSAVGALKEKGVKEVYVAATHGVLSQNALRKIKALGLKKIIITNTIPPHETDTILEILPIEDYLVPIIKD